MKQKWVLCLLACVLALNCVNAGAVTKINSATATASSGATVTKKGDQNIEVVYEGAKNQEYVLMAVSPDGIDQEVSRPTTTSINHNQDDVIIYMNQASGDASGNVTFNVVYPEDADAKTGDEFFLYISTNQAGSVMTQVGSFTVSIEELLRILGDVNNDGSVNIADVQKLLNILIDNTKLEGSDLSAANVTKDENNQISVASVQRLLNMIINNEAKEYVN